MAAVENCTHPDPELRKGELGIASTPNYTIYCHSFNSPRWGLPMPLGEENGRRYCLNSTCIFWKQVRNSADGNL